MRLQLAVHSPTPQNPTPTPKDRPGPPPPPWPRAGGGGGGGRTFSLFGRRRRPRRERGGGRRRRTNQGLLQGRNPDFLSSCYTAHPRLSIAARARLSPSPSSISPFRRRIARPPPNGRLTGGRSLPFGGDEGGGRPKRMARWGRGRRKDRGKARAKEEGGGDQKNGAGCPKNSQRCTHE